MQNRPPPAALGSRLMTRYNDFVIKLATSRFRVDIANGMFAKSRLRMGVPGNAQHLPVGTPGLPTRPEVRAAEAGYPLPPRRRRRAVKDERGNICGRRREPGAVDISGPTTPGRVHANSRARRVDIGVLISTPLSEFQDPNNATVQEHRLRRRVLALINDFDVLTGMVSEQYSGKKTR